MYKDYFKNSGTLPVNGKEIVKIVLKDGSMLTGEAQLYDWDLHTSLIPIVYWQFDKPIETKVPEDNGKHYRFETTVKVPEGAKEVTLKLDPFRIAEIYGMTDFALLTVLKKVLCAGNRGHKDLRKDIEDCICALERKIEMMNEDEGTPEFLKEQAS